MIKYLVLFFCCIVTSYPQNQCISQNERIRTFIYEMDASKFDDPDINNYSDFTDRYTRYAIEIKNSKCPQSDSLYIEIMYFYALFVVKQQGDLEKFSNLLENCNILIDEHIRRLIADSSSDKSSNNDEIRKKWSPRKTRIQNNLYDLKNNYADLNIYLLTQKPLKEMTKVYTQKDGVNKPVKIHFRPPIEILKDDMMRRRLAFLSNEYEMILTKYDESRGFYFSIPLVPLSEFEEPDPNQTYAITFDDKARYRLHEFNAVSQSSLYIQALPEWVFQQIIPENYTKIVLPNNIPFDLFNKLTGDNMSKSGFTIIEFEDETIIYLPVYEAGSNNIGLRLKDDSQYWFWIMTLLSTVLIIGAALYV